MKVRRQALLLAVLTGFCGLGSESAYLKLLDFSIGSAPLVAYAVVATFIVGMGVGSLLSPRVRRPWLVEALLAAYNLAMVLGLAQVLRFNSAALGVLMPVLGPNVAPAALGVCYLVPPTILLGITFPALVEKSEDTGRAYLSQAAGALLGILAVEAVLYPGWGLNGALLVMAGLHAVSATLLSRHGTFRFPVTPLGRVSGPLLWVGTGTGAFQGVWLLLAALLFHPFYFIQPIVIGTMLGGIFLGSLLWSYLDWSFDRVVSAVVVGIALSTGLVAAWMFVPPPGSLTSVVVQVPLLLLPAAIPIGAIYPAWLATRQVERNRAGAALLSLSVGNAVGVFLAGALLLPHLTPILCLAAIAAFVAVVPWRGASPVKRLAGVALVVAVAGCAWVADEPTIIKRTRIDHREVTVEKIFRGPGELSAIYDVVRRPEGSWHTWTERRLYMSGFAPFIIEANQSLLQEATAGAITVASAPRRGRALVLGAGSGRAAGFVARYFEHTDVVDIGATVPAILRTLGPENYGLLDNPGVVYHPMDAILAPEFFAGQQFDVIFCTVNPVYVNRAAKLYTLEYIEALRGLLAPDGILVSWSDSSVSARANQILINTVGAPFGHQRLLSVIPDWGFGYYLMIQSDQPILFRPVELLDPRSPLSGDPAVQSLREPLARRLILGRADATEARHSFFSPQRDILFGGYPHFGNERRSPTP